MTPTPEPLSHEEIEALLRPDPRSQRADLLVLRDALQRLGDAWQRIAEAAGELSRAAQAIDQQRARAAQRPGEIERRRPIPPRAD